MGYSGIGPDGNCNYSSGADAAARTGLRGASAHEQNTIDLGRNSSRHRAFRTARFRRAPPTSLEEVIVTGIRVFEQLSLDTKREATSVVEVITAEDIGKMPDKNVADSLSRLTGVTISSASANEGGFDENDRISMRGTNPSLTQTLLNGHNVAAGDWFVLNQVQQVGRSVSYTLLPSELVDQIIVHKSSQARSWKAASPARSTSSRASHSTSREQFTFSASAGARVRRAAG